MQVRVLPGSCSEWHTWLSRKKVAAESSNVKVCSIPPGRSTLQVTSLHNDSKQGPVAQWIRHRPTEPGIAGSSPAGVMLPHQYCMQYFFLRGSTNVQVSRLRWHTLDSYSRVPSPSSLESAGTCVAECRAICALAAGFFKREMQTLRDLGCPNSE